MLNCPDERGKDGPDFCSGDEIAVASTLMELRWARRATEGAEGGAGTY
jgi:hypothetical protein